MFHPQIQKSKKLLFSVQTTNTRNQFRTHLEDKKLQTTADIHSISKLKLMLLPKAVSGCFGKRRISYWYVTCMCLFVCDCFPHLIVYFLFFLVWNHPTSTPQAWPSVPSCAQWCQDWVAPEEALRLEEPHHSHLGSGKVTVELREVT